MIGEEYKKVSVLNEHIPKRQVESDNKPKKKCQLKKRRLSKALGRKYARLNERLEEVNTT